MVSYRTILWFYTEPFGNLCGHTLRLCPLYLILSPIWPDFEAHTLSV